MWFSAVADLAYVPLTPEVALRSDCQPNPNWRARSLASRIPKRAVLGGRTAFWVHTGRGWDPHLDLVVAVGSAQVRMPGQRPSRQAQFQTDDVVTLEGVQVTSVQRTGLDLSRFSPPEQVLGHLSVLLSIGFDPQQAIESLGHTRSNRGARQARQALDSISCEPPAQIKFVPQ